jgi:hypothetical protein
VTLKNGDIITIYLDADAFLEIKEKAAFFRYCICLTSGLKPTVRGSEQELEASLGDYREVNV